MSAQINAELPPLAGAAWEWREHAACRGGDQELFFYSDRERGRARRRRETAAKAICATCPVKIACLSWALAVQEPYGVWGGLTAESRQALLGPRAVHR